jgi:hypothetical protein
MPIFDETVTIRPKDNKPAIVIQQAVDNSYGFVQWVDAQGEFMAGIAAHRVTNDAITHNHMTFYLADPTAKNGRRGKVDLQFDKERSTISVEGADVLMKGTDSRLLLRSPNGGFYHVSVGDDGQLSARRLTRDERTEVLKAGGQ